MSLLSWVTSFLFVTGRTGNGQLWSPLVGWTSVILNILTMEWMGKQNYSSTNTDCYQRQRFSSRAVLLLDSCVIRCFGQDWFIIELMDSDSCSYSCPFSTLSLFSLDNEVCHIETSSRFVFHIYGKMLEEMSSRSSWNQELWAGTLWK